MAETIQYSTAHQHPVWHYFGVIRMLRSLWRYRGLSAQLILRDVAGRYRGSHLGLFWSVVQPVLMLGIYTFVFGLVFKSRWPQARTGRLSEFAVIVFAGIVVFNVFGECLGRASLLVVNNSNYVKRVLFPLEILPVSTLGAALLHGLVNVAVVVLAHFLLNGEMHATALLAPLVLLPLICLTLGATWALAAVGVYFRDMHYLVSVGLTVMLFATPIFYSWTIVPDPWGSMLFLNPLAVVVDSFRNVVLWGTSPDWLPLAVWMAATVPVLAGGYAVFMFSKPGFADVL